MVCYDPQTSGGLLYAMPEGDAERLLNLLAGAEYPLGLRHHRQGDRRACRNDLVLLNIFLQVCKTRSDKATLESSIYAISRTCLSKIKTDDRLQRTEEFAPAANIEFTQPVVLIFIPLLSHDRMVVKGAMERYGYGKVVSGSWDQSGSTGSAAAILELDAAP